MKAVDLTLNGQTYSLCFNLSVLIEICDKYGDLEAMFDTFDSKGVGESIKDYAWLCSALTKGGAEFGALNGISYPTISYAELIAVADVFDYARIKAKTIEAMTRGQDTEIKINGKSKNAEATVENA